MARLRLLTASDIYVKYIEKCLKNSNKKSFDSKFIVQESIDTLVDFENMKKVLKENIIQCDQKFSERDYRQVMDNLYNFDIAEKAKPREQQRRIEFTEIATKLVLWSREILEKKYKD